MSKVIPWELPSIEGGYDVLSPFNFDNAVFTVVYGSARAGSYSNSKTTLYGSFVLNLLPFIVNDDSQAKFIKITWTSPDIVFKANGVEVGTKSTDTQTTNISLQHVAYDPPKIEYSTTISPSLQVNGDQRNKTITIEPSTTATLVQIQVFNANNEVIQTFTPSS